MNFTKHPEGFLYAQGKLGIYFISGEAYKILRRCSDGYNIETIDTFHHKEDAIVEANRLEHEAQLQRLCDSIITEEVMELCSANTTGKY